MQERQGSTRRNISRIIFVILLSLCWIVIRSSASPGAGSKTYVVAASKASWDVDLDRIECVSTVPNRATIFQKDFFENSVIVRTMQEIWPKKEISKNNPNCPYVLVFTIGSATTRAVQYRGEPAIVLMSFQVCHRESDTRINANVCSYKNLYLFQRDFSDHEAFEIGLRAFVQPQEIRQKIINISFQRN
jgi:hypothetical protein